MKIRGSITITKSLLLPNPNGTTPREGLIALSDANGSLKWGDLLVPVIVDEVYPKSGALAISENKLYFSIQDNASGSLPLDPLFWVEVGTGAAGGVDLPQNQIDALDAAAAPSGTNPFATLDDISNLNIQGSTTIAAILASNASSPNRLWISTDAGVDSYDTPVIVGDGLVSNGSGWYNIGQFRGPIGPQGDIGPTGSSIQIEGTDTVLSIVAKDATTPALLWLAFDTGLDTYGTAVAAGDGLISDGVGWKTTGPVRGPQGDIGPVGPGLPAGGGFGDRLRKAIGGDYSIEWFKSKFTYTQIGTAVQWDIAHNLGDYPTIQIVDDTNMVIEGQIEHVDLNNSRIFFNVALEGKAYLRI